MKFEDYRISPDIKRSIAKLGFKRPTDIQFKAIPNILKGEDLLAIAQTGTGKTAAFVIPVLSLLNDRKQGRKRADGIKCLVMVPTRELAIQINDVFVELGRHTKVKTFAIFGGVEQAAQIEKLQKGLDVLVATPGRMFDLISQKHLLTFQIEILVLDEADHMLDLGFVNDIRDLIVKLPKRRQTLFLSATINNRIKKIAYSLVKQNAIRIQLSPKDPVAKKIDHAVLFVEMDHKRFFLERMVTENPEAKILVFVRTKVRAERVAKAMGRVDIDALTIHSDKTQAERAKIMKDFRAGDCSLLIATDVSARGIDIPNIDIVINYDLPEIAENYVHRVGRTGRANKQGQAYSFCAPDEKDTLEEIQSFLKKEIQVIPLTKASYQETLTMETDRNEDLDALMKDIEQFEKVKKSKRKKK